MTEREIDATQALMALPVTTLILFANKALNRMTFRDIGEICHDLGLHPDIAFPATGKLMDEDDEANIEGPDFVRGWNAAMGSQGFDPVEPHDWKPREDDPQTP